MGPVTGSLSLLSLRSPLKYFAGMDCPLGFRSVAENN
jgi:hypothetical protein